MKAKKPTAGERIVGVPTNGSLRIDMTSEELTHLKALARRIDAAIRRAVREAWWAGRRSVCSNELQPHIERKYGVRL